MSKNVEDFIPTRESLLTRLKDWDDAEGWRRFVETYWSLIYNVALRAGLKDAEAKDVVQETILAVAKKMRTFNYDPALGSFKAWLHVVTRSRIVDFLRKKHRHSAVVALEGEQEFAAWERLADPASEEFHQVWDEEWQKTLFEAAVRNVKNQVSPKQFQIFDLYVLQEQPILKISKALGINAAQVYLAKHRISQLIKNEVRRLEKETS